MSLADGYREDLAYIHDAGFGGFARGAAPWLLELLRAKSIRHGLVIDLGCGSGLWAQALVEEGYNVLGYDLSPAMIELARRRVPKGEFRQQSFLSAELPSCVAVTAMGEIFNYKFDQRNSAAEMRRMFARVHAALAPGGIFVFDGATPDRAGKSGQTSGYTQGDDWACLFTATEDRRQNLLTREITSFRRVGRLFRRDHEVHRLRLFNRRELLAQLRTLGFRARTVTGYGVQPFPPGYVGIVARKP
ncbi:MAG TPA: methyltransferase domain-containing protein [Pirellulales bacterium]|jgi:SAM-dependent methyltransferase|nr:methyltransferase domain-containing protein [Pirellulales bacterium]